MDDESFFAAFIQGIEFKAFASYRNEMYNNKTKCIEFHISHIKNIIRSYPHLTLSSIFFYAVGFSEVDDDDDDKMNIRKKENYLGLRDFASFSEK